jgi:hypothetical protein
MQREVKFYAQAGYQCGRGPDLAYLSVTRHTPVGEALDTERTEMHYELFFNDDTNEVVLTKGDEIVYSELLA